MNSLRPLVAAASSSSVSISSSPSFSAALIVVSRLPSLLSPSSKSFHSSPSPSSSLSLSSSFSVSSNESLRRGYHSLIRFRHGKRDPGPVAQKSSLNNNNTNNNNNDWERDNDRAYQAWLELPSRYKRSIYNEEWQSYVQLGGARPDPPKPVAKDGAKPAKKKK